MNIYFKHDIRKASLDNIEQTQTFTYAIKENGSCLLRLQQSIKYGIWKESPLKWNVQWTALLILKLNVNK